MVSAIGIRDLIKSYGDVRALDDIDLGVPEGSFFGLLGPNGAGKTTSIDIFIGLVRKAGGEASVFGYDVGDGYHEARGRIGFVPQEFDVDRFPPIHEVLERKVGYHGTPHDEAVGRADEVFKRVDIYDKRDARFGRLSGGTKRRFMPARTFITDPDLLILDEPATGVDVQLCHELRETIVGLNDSETATLLTAHHIEEAECLYDEVVILDSGSVVETANPEELMDHGTDDIVVQLRDLPTAVPDFMADDDHVETVELDDTRLVVTTQQGSFVAPNVVQMFDRQGRELVDLGISRTSLEEVFVEMTRQGESRAIAEVEQ